MRALGLVLLVEDDATLRDALQEILEEEGWQVLAAANRTQAEEHLKHGPVDVAVLDVRLPDGNGIELLRALKSQDPDLGAIVMTGYAEVDTAIEAMRLGADDFLKKPFDFAELLARLEEIRKRRLLKRENRLLKARLRAAEGERELIGQHPEIVRLRETAALVADTDATVLITGESGTGKEVLARLIHRLSPRADKPFVAINCGAIPEDLLESELFGHVKGAFTGATRTRPGRFELAHGGTIFLDEIGDMSPKLQVKLLRVLQERVIEPVGGDRAIEVDVRVIAATHRNLRKAIEEGTFREDLFYRLDVVPMHLPPLRERGEDILLLAEEFIRRCNERLGAELSGIEPEAREVMLKYRWPGNVRELQNVIERIAILKREGVIGVDDLPSRMLDLGARTKRAFSIDLEAVDAIDLKALVDEFETEIIEAALKRFHGNKTRAAQFLSMNRTTLLEKIKKKGIRVPSE